MVTGTPVRGDFFTYTRKEAREKLGLTDDRPMVLSYWGSLGAAVMNGYRAGLLDLECKAGEPFHHLHGAGRDYERLTGELNKKGVRLSEHPRLEVREYIYDMPVAMAAADLVVCRAGASTVSELSALAKPSVLVPSPNVVADHQTKNAKVLADKGGAVLLPEKDCSPQVLWQAVSDLLESPEKRAAMSRALREMAIPDANEKIYGTLMELLGR